MKKIRSVAVLGPIVLWAVAAWAGAPLTREQGLKLMAETGRWIETDGVLQPDGTYLAKEIEIYAPGDTAEIGEVAISGAVHNLNRLKSTLSVFGYLVTYDGETTLKDENKRPILSSKIQNGMGVKVQGSLQPNGTFKATKIKLQKGKTKDGAFKAKEQIFGPVSVVDARNGLLKVLNTGIKLREDALLTEKPLTPP